MQKGNQMTIVDARTTSEAITAPAHLGPKVQRMSWVDDTTFISAGFSKQAEREHAIWDIRDLSAPTQKGPLGDGNTVVHIHFDTHHNLFYASGKGESKTSIYLYQTGQPLAFISDYMSNTPMKGMTFLPKWALDTSKNEANRIARMDKNKIEYVSFVL